MIAANSPQAKGRVERNHGLDQDRLVKELRPAGISTIAGANAFLEHTYQPAMNRTFSRPPADSADAHVPLGETKLKDIFCFEYERPVCNDYVVRFNTCLFQILKTNTALPRPKGKVPVRVLLDGAIDIMWNKTKLLVKEITNNYKTRKIRDVA